MRQLTRSISSLSVFNKFFYGVIVIVLLILALSLFASYTYSQNIYEKQASENASRLVKGIDEGFKSNLDQVDRIIMSIYNDLDSENSNFLSSTEYSGLTDEYRTLQLTQTFYQRLLNLRPDFNSIYIYVSPSKQISYAVNGIVDPDYNPQQDDWFVQTVAAGGSTIISAPHDPFQLHDAEKVISFSRILKRFDTNKDDSYGVILIDLSMDAIQSIVDKADLSSETGVMILDGGGETLFADGPLSSGEGLSEEARSKVASSPQGMLNLRVDGKKYLLTYGTIGITGWKSLTLTPFSEIQKDRDKLLLFSLALAAVALLITIVIAYLFSKRLFKPIHTLKQGIVQVKQGNFNIDLEPPTSDELGQVVFSFNSMVKTIKQLIEEKYEEALARQDAEFRYLQSQMNPHFMFNTLQTINGMAIVNEVPEISAASSNLARMLRYNIDMKQRTVTIREELENAVCYLQIQKIRFREYLDYELSLDEDIYDCTIIKLILQPILENAIVHGIEPKGDNGSIRLSGSRLEDSVRIQVLDNGIGMTNEQLERLMRSLREDRELGEESFSEEKYRHNRVGLKNIHKRIQIIYGHEYGITVESSPGEWTRVIIDLPVTG
ncbi:two-component system, sensor histidine kinase YesM [Paenibacillus catalpae]|uniref:Two-component system, sensor histidine kinase YesM n=1 Tax=Paenibacillus catalpae TaxID=1045775 RepID=A0A1I2AFZ8_9BACL|nr:sensor histidine kinase [Paenibacillus catalpae]SFE41750.1 two-component system, sensor histidine kinase YesM [Paenibacillus catalpae]